MNNLQELLSGLFDNPYEENEDAYQDWWGHLADQNGAFDGSAHSWEVRNEDRL